MSKFYSIQKLCELTSVSVRTLHYYDEINLLKPSHRTPKNHRLYSQQDLFHLQQIVVLKYIGFSLEQIKKFLKKNKLSMLESLRLQAKALAQETLRIEKASRCINYLIKQNESHDTLDWGSVTKIIDVLKFTETDTQQWYEKYLSEIELQQFNKFKQTRSQEWESLFKEVKKAIKSGSSSDKEAELAKKLIALIDEAYGNHPDLKTKLTAGFKAGIISQSSFPYDQDIINYFEKALEVYSK